MVLVNAAGVGVAESVDACFRLSRTRSFSFLGASRLGLLAQSLGLGLGLLGRSLRLSDLLLNGSLPAVLHTRNGAPHDGVERSSLALGDSFQQRNLV